MQAHNPLSVLNHSPLQCDQHELEHRPLVLLAGRYGQVEQGQPLLHLSQRQLEALWELLPPLLRGGAPALLYSAAVHGYALRRLYDRLNVALGETAR